MTPQHRSEFEEQRGTAPGFVASRCQHYMATLNNNPMVMASFTPGSGAVRK